MRFLRSLFCGFFHARHYHVKISGSRFVESCRKCGYQRVCLALFLLSLLSAPGAQAGTNEFIRLEFDPSPSEMSNYVSNYFVAYGRFPRGTNNTTLFYQNHKSVPKTNGPIVVAVSNLTYGPHFFSAYAIATNGEISTLANEVGWTNRTWGPQNLRITGPADALALQSSPDLQNWKTLAVIVSSNTPLMIVAESRSFLRTMTTNVPPPLPR